MADVHREGADEAGERGEKAGERPGLWLVIGTGYSYKVTASLVDRWEGCDLKGRNR